MYPQSSLSIKNRRPALAAANSLVLWTTLCFGLDNVSAQTIPDAGQSLQQLQQPLPAPSSNPRLAFPAPLAEPAQAEPPAGGPRITLKGVSIRGNSIFDDKTLQQVAGLIAGASFDFKGLEQIARSISSFYHQNGFPFAAAALPAQDLKDGVLQIEVIEGRYGKIEASGDFPAETGGRFLAHLKPGDVIEGGGLERTVLIIDDLPMISVSPSIRPGSVYGTGDLNIEVTQDAHWGGEVGADNLGNRFTGEYRVRASLNGYSKFVFGDAIRLSSIVTNESLKLGSVEYEAPLNGEGLRAQASVARTTYQLARDYAYLGASGVADVFSARLSYPVIRTQLQNVSVSIGYVAKHLNDRYDFVGANNRKLSHSVPLSIYFDSRDRFLDGGLTYGNVVLTAHGRLTLDDGLLATDALTARSAGDFSKVNIELARIQTLPANFSLFGRILVQTTDNNLDSSEKFNLGGIYGVRAYPMGEGLGDRGWFAQAELRYRFDSFTGFLLTDGGVSRLNAHPWDVVIKNSSHVRASGFGMRHQQDLGWNWEAVLAWRTADTPVSDRASRNPRLWASVNYKF